MAVIDKKLLKHLAALARLELTAKEGKQFLKDLKAILDYFGELRRVDVKKIKPMSGGAGLINVFREDEVDIEKKSGTVSDAGRIIDAFPETEKGYLKVPKVL